MNTISRRDMIKKSVAFVGGSAVLLNLPVDTWAKSNQSADTKVVLVRDQQLFANGDEPNATIANQMLDRAVCLLTGENDSATAWKTIINQTDVLGIKTNGWNNLPTPAILNQALKERALGVGIKEENISINDRDVLTDPVFQKATALINIRPMRTHAWSGVGTLIKNYITFSNNRPSYHDDSCASLATLYNLPEVKGKTRLNVLVMFRPQFHHLAANQVSEEFLWKYSGLLVGFDPVAVDSVGLRVIEAKRNEYFKESTPLNPPAKHIALADTQYHIGTADPAKINLIKFGWDENSFV
jgi:hypothetical protein